MSHVEQRFDDLSKALVTKHSRRTVLKAGLGLAAAALASALPGRARAGGGNSDAAHFCNEALPPGPERGKCKSDAAHGTGFFFACAGDLSRICGEPTNMVCCNPAAGEACCAATSTCVTCPPGTVFNAATCICEPTVCAAGPPCPNTVCAGHTPGPSGSCTCSETIEGPCMCLGTVNCSNFQRCGSSAECPPGFACRSYPENPPPCGFGQGRRFCVEVC